MREIEFRGLTEEGEWVYGNLIYTISMNNSVQKHHTLIGINLDLTEVIPETVGQWTGLENKYGQKIYEGDILLNTLPLVKENNPAQIVKWGVYQWKGIWNFKHCKVIGNIHDNKLKER